MPKETLISISSKYILTKINISEFGEEVSSSMFVILSDITLLLLDTTSLNRCRSMPLGGSSKSENQSEVIFCFVSLMNFNVELQLCNN